MITNNPTDKDALSPEGCQKYLETLSKQLNAISVTWNFPVNASRPTSSLPVSSLQTSGCGSGYGEPITTVQFI